MKFKMLKRFPIIQIKGMIIYLIMLSNTTSTIGPIKQECSESELVMFFILISFLIGLLIEVMKEI